MPSRRSSSVQERSATLPAMPPRSRSGLFVALAIFVALAVVIRVFGGPIYKALLAMHGKH